MKFLQLLTLTSAALAVPAPVTEETSIEAVQFAPQGNINDTLVSILSALNATAAGNIQAINTTITGIQGSVDAQIQVTVGANLNAIVKSLTTAYATLTNTTKAGVASILNSISSLTNQQASDLVNGVKKILDLLSQVKVILSLTVTNLTPAVQTAISGETTAVKAALSPFLGPLSVLITALQTASVSATASVTGLGPLIQGLVSELAVLISV